MWNVPGWHDVHSFQMKEPNYTQIDVEDENFKDGPLEQRESKMEWKLEETLRETTSV